MTYNVFPRFIAVAFACLFVGCGSQYPTVSGTVTYDGKPISNVRLVFSPVPSENGGPTGPYSQAVSDEDGAFSLETRDGKSGAVVGVHKVGFDWSDIRSYTIRDLKSALQESKGDPEKQARLKAKIADVKQKLESRPELKAGLQTNFTVTEGGSSEVVFELTDF